MFFGIYRRDFERLARTLSCEPVTAETHTVSRDGLDNCDHVVDRGEYQSRRLVLPGYLASSPATTGVNTPGGPSGSRGPYTPLQVFASIISRLGGV